MKRKSYALFVAACCVFASARINALTLSDIETAVRINVRDTASGSTAQKYSDTVLDALINEGQRDVINQTWAITTRYNIALVAGTQAYLLPSDVISIFQVTLNSANLPEVEITQLDADNNNASWLASGAPRYYFQYPNEPNYIYITPYPNSSNTGTARVYYAAYATDMDNDADEPFDGIDRLAGYHDLLVYFPTIRILMIEGRSDQAALFVQLYQSGIQIMNENVGKKKTKIPPVKVTNKP